jgi:hypothetical protein
MKDEDYKKVVFLHDLQPSHIDSLSNKEKFLPLVKI